MSTALLLLFASCVAVVVTAVVTNGDQSDELELLSAEVNLQKFIKCMLKNLCRRANQGRRKVTLDYKLVAT